MVYQHIKVYARLRNELKEQSLVSYKITKKKKQYEDLMLYPGTSSFLNSCCGFRFYKVFNVNGTQAEVFDLVAKPVICSVIEGFNGTIFAYGQVSDLLLKELCEKIYTRQPNTGSGKTYSITGSSKNYDERGIIPRSIQYIFKHYENISEKPTIYISYMEIYNEVGYDLLCTKQSKVSRILDDLPRVSIFEDKTGEAHIRNLNVFPVITEQEAMRLLFLGDTNRTIAETVSNEFSSRSHCIFTLYINLRDCNSSNLRSSKLYLVDLAGSERISKTHSKGLGLQEAKSINLSLHFLQQVILALSESNRTHIPYRNSMLTHILKDSLNGNCITSMLATLSTLQCNIEESLSTCRFAQKVSMIATDPMINVLDPQKEIHFLKLRIEDLEKQLSLATGFSNSMSLSKKKMEEYVVEVKSFVGADKKFITVKPDMTEIQFCFNLLKNEVTNKKKECVQLENTLMEKTEGIYILNDELLKKDKEIVQLKNIIDKIPEKPVSLNPFEVQSTSESSIHSIKNNMLHVSVDDVSCTHSIKNNIPHVSVDEEKLLYEIFMSQSEISRDLIFYKKGLEKQFSQAKLCIETIKKCQKQINLIKQQLDTPLSWIERNRLIPELEKYQEIYKKTLLEMKNIQSETVHLQCGLKGAEVKSKHAFKIWMQEYIKDSNHRLQCDDQKLSKRYYVSDGASKEKQFNGVSGFDNHQHTENRKNIRILNSCTLLENFSFENLDDFLNIQCCYDPNEENQCYFIEKPNTISNEHEHACSSIECIHCCRKFHSDSTLLPSISSPSSNHLVATDKCTTAIKRVSEVPTANKKSVSSIITLKNGDGMSDEQLFATKKSQSSVNENKMMKNYTYETEPAEKDVDHWNGIEKYFIETDTLEFKEFMKSVAVTGLDEIDHEIFGFYRSKFC